MNGKIFVIFGYYLSLNAENFVMLHEKEIYILKIQMFPICMLFSCFLNMLLNPSFSGEHSRSSWIKVDFPGEFYDLASWGNT